MSDSFRNTLQVLGELISRLGLQDFEIVKNENECITLESPDYFYKMRRFDSEDPTIYFECILGQAFAEEYRRLGIDWKFCEVSLDDGFWAVEVREKLDVLNPGQFSLQEALLQSAKVTRTVERKLGFPNLTAQIRQEAKFDDVDRIYILRYAKPQFHDFAIKSGLIVCLGSSNRFLALSDRDGNWKHSKQGITREVSLNCQKCFFSGKNESSIEQKLGKFQISNNGFWWIFSHEVGTKMSSDRDRALLQVQKMNLVNLKILTKKQAFPVLSVDSLGCGNYSAPFDIKKGSLRG